MSAPASTKVTDRQRKVIDGLKAKKTPQAIAAEMGISVNGVYGHMRRLRKAGLIPAEKASTNGKSAPARKAGSRRRATTSRRRASSNGSRRNGRGVETPVIEAIDAARAAGVARLGEIEQETAKLGEEKAAIEKALVG